jgi:hypothetical protein
MPVDAFQAIMCGKPVKNSSGVSYWVLVFGRSQSQNDTFWAISFVSLQERWELVRIRLVCIPGDVFQAIIRGKWMDIASVVSYPVFVSGGAQRPNSHVSSKIVSLQVRTWFLWRIRLIYSLRDMLQAIIRGKWMDIASAGTYSVLVFGCAQPEEWHVLRNIFRFFTQNSVDVADSINL